MNPFVWINGKVVPAGEARISPFDLGFLRGYGIFDFLTCEGSTPFLFDEHFARLEKCAGFLGYELPFSKTEFRSIIETLIEKNKFDRSIIRSVVTGGESADGITPAEKPTVVILNTPYTTLPEKTFAGGAKLITLEHSRHTPAVKTNGYFDAIHNQKKKRDAGALEILYVRDGNVLECATSNIFIVKDGSIATPRANILPGLTRELVIKLIGNDFPLEERSISAEELFDADEIFITASGKDVVPIIEIDGERVGGGAPGEVTKEIMRRYREFAADYYAR